MLSCRYSGPETTQYERRLASASRTLEIISDGYERIPPLPLVPYAMSMVTAVIYRALRDEKRDRTSAYRDLKCCYKTLYALSHIWTSARGVAKLTRRLLRRLSRSDDNSTPPGISQEHTGDRSSTSLAQILHDKHPTTAHQLNPVSGSEERNDSEMDHFSLPTAGPLLRDELGSTDALDSLNQLYEPWIDTPMSYPHFDMAFGNFFDDGPPNIFQDPLTWDPAGG